MFIPVGTDAPIYHFPFATILLASLNVAAHVGLAQYDPDAVGLSPTKQDWSLWFGEGLHPLQWVTSCFLHAGWLHLIGNIVFLWGFGIIVEGKLGWWRFLLLYVAVGAIACGIEQTALLHGRLTDPPRAELERLYRERGDDPREIQERLAAYNNGAGYPDHIVALGASGAIFGLVAISMIWAPRNDLDVLWIIWVHIGIGEISILAFSLLYIGLEIVVLSFQASMLGVEYAVSSAFLHTVGVLVGGAAGVLLLKKGWVDCENWDLFAVLKGTHGNRDAFEEHSRYHRELTVPSQTASGASGADGPEADDDRSPDAPERPGRRAKKKPRRKVDPLARLQKHLDGGDGISALGEWETLTATRPKLVPPEPTLFALAEAVDKANFAEEAGALFALYLRSYPKPKPDDPPPAEGEPPVYDAAHAGVIRLRAARRLLERPGRRAQAATLLKAVDGDALAPRQRKTLEKLTAAAAG